MREMGHEMPIIIRNKQKCSTFQLKQCTKYMRIDIICHRMQITWRLVDD